MQYNKINSEKFNEIYKTFHNDVYKLSLYYTKDTYAAEDVVQKVFYQFYIHSSNVDEDRVRAYLLHSARNMSFNWLRDKKKEVTGEYLDVLEEEEVPYHSAEDEYIRDERSRERSLFVNDMLECLRKENESWYQVVNLILCLDKPHDEVAKELGMTRDVLYSKLYRAKKWLRKNFEKEFKDL